MKTLLLTMLLTLSIAAHAGPHYLSGKLSNIASSSQYISIMLDTGVPENCNGVAYNWMRINKEDTVMVSMILSMWVAKKNNVTVYTRRNADGQCDIYSLDPVFNQ